MKETLKISGMSCHHCVRAVEEALSGVDGVEVIHVEIGSAEVAYDPGKVARERLVEAVAEEGYTVEG
jgi:copper chaperone